MSTKALATVIFRLRTVVRSLLSIAEVLPEAGQVEVEGAIWSLADDAPTEQASTEAEGPSS